MNAYLHDMNDDLLVKYLLGEASASERREVENWVAADPGNQRYFDHFKLIWEKSKKLAATSTVDEEQAWRRFQQITGQLPSEQPALRSINRRMRSLRVAAVLVLTAGILGLGYLLWKQNTIPREIVISTGPQPQSDTLPDGSIVVLNKKSSITYPTAFKGGNRPVQLKGEAFFRITPDKDKPFVVQINDVTVTVLGTSFNVKSINGKTEVIVETGLVKVSRAQQSIQLKPKEKLLVSPQDPLLNKENVTDQLYKYYRTREFVCDNTPLWKLVDVLNEAYDTHIVIERKELKSLQIDIPLYDESLDRILELIVETFKEYKIQVVKNDSTILLK